MTEQRDLATSLASAAVEIGAARGIEETVRTILRVIRESVPGIDGASVVVPSDDGTMTTYAASDGAVEKLDRLQSEVGEGPCVEALHSASSIRVVSAPHEQRWSRYIAVAAPLGLRAQLAVRLRGDGATLGVLSLYSFTDDLLPAETNAWADLFATYAGLALAHARRVEHLQTALESRRTIGLALGILMARLDLSEEAAFAYLTRRSATTETKLRDVAAALVAEHGQSLGSVVAFDRRSAD